MNKTYKIVFNRARGRMMVVNENTASTQKHISKKVALAAILSAIFASSAFASASDGVTFGEVAINGETVTPATSNGTYIVGSNNDDIVIGNNTATSRGVDIAAAEDVSVTILGKNISITGEQRGVQTTWPDHNEHSNSLTIGNTDTDTITINQTSSAENGTIAVSVMDENSSLSLTAKHIKVNASGQFGVHAQSFDENNTQTNPAQVTLTATNGGDITVINTLPSGIGLSAYSGSTLTVNGNLTVKAFHAIETRGNSTININTDGKSTTVLNGDIVFGTTNVNSGKIFNSKLNLNLTGSNSSWTGNLKTEYPSDLAAQYQQVSNANITIADGAQWNVTKVNEVTEGSDISKSLALNNLTLKNGVVSIQDTSTTVKIDNLQGSGGTVNVAASTDDGATLTTAKLEASTSSVEKLDVALTGIDADDISDTDSALASAAGAVSAGDSKTTVTIKEGAVNGAITADTTGGTVKSVTTAENTKLTAFNSVSAMATMAWRHDMNDLTKRMGELRDSPEGIGSWVRFYGSEQEYGRQNMTNKSTSVQLGSDYDIGSGWKVGGAFTYTDGTAKYDNGSSDNKAYGVAAYGSWLADNGAFVDLIGKYSRLSSDFELSSMDGKSKNNALSASVEAGWHIPFAELAFVEPQAELTYGVVLGDDFTTSNGVKISQEDTEALIGRLGVRTGFHFPNKKGTVYARASVLHDFKGESEFTASLVDDASVRSTMKDDIGGTYYEIGVGANFNWTDNAYSYVDLEKQNGGDVKENWRWNVGFRYVW